MALTSSEPIRSGACLKGPAAMAFFTQEERSVDPKLCELDINWGNGELSLLHQSDRRRHQPLTNSAC
jgi:hypothetical protein